MPHLSRHVRQPALPRPAAGGTAPSPAPASTGTSCMQHRDHQKSRSSSLRHPRKNRSSHPASAQLCRAMRPHQRHQPEDERHRGHHHREESHAREPSTAASRIGIPGLALLLGKLDNRDAIFAASAISTTRLRSPARRDRPTSRQFRIPSRRPAHPPRPKTAPAAGSSSFHTARPTRNRWANSTDRPKDQSRLSGRQLLLVTRAGPLSRPPARRQRPSPR